MPNPIRAMLTAPFIQRVAFHVRRVGSQMDRHFFTSLLGAVVAFVAIAAIAITLIEDEKRSLGGLGSSFYWSVTTIIGSGDPSYVNSIGGYFIGWLLAFFGVAFVAGITGAVVGFVIDFLLKEGQGMGAAGFRDHFVVCGWNTTARDLIRELRTDEYTAKVVVLHDLDRNPAGDGVYYVRGDITDADDLRRAGIDTAEAAIVFPADGSNEADMRSILAVMAIEAIAPQVRTVVEANNPDHVEHFQRANADEILVSSRLGAHLLARSALYPGLSAIVTDIVSGGEGSELYRVALPDEYIGYSVDELSAKLRGEHRATLLAVTRDGRSILNPPADFRLQAGDDAVVVAEGLGTLRPLELQQG